ncbi:hypothetical protein [Parafrigoribacterium soli]|uniref:hypothetical protein n=1 Tax=Parafrigoribacterium soli TaxID=3144663 RepID=UPI0032EC19B0
MGEESEQGVSTPDVAPPEPSPPTEIGEPPAPRSPTATLGWIAIGLVALCVLADAVAVTLAVGRYWPAATTIAQGTNVATAVVFVVGLFAAFRRPARWLGILAMVLAVLANPFILTHLLDFLGG